MEQNTGRPEIRIALIDGPVATNHPDLSNSNISEISAASGGACTRHESAACMHGTLVAGILSARRGSSAPAICPDCTLLVRPIFPETGSPNSYMPSATPEALGAAIIECVSGGAQLINLSAALAQSSSKSERFLAEALDYCGHREVIVIAAAGNQGNVGSSLITRHPWVIPVVACDLKGRPVGYSNLGNSIGRRGLCAPGLGITSTGPDGEPHVFGGTSAAAPFVTGSLALLFSAFPNASPGQIKLALIEGSRLRRHAIIPPVLNAWAAYQRLQQVYR
jgi:subtilisin family serine protease